MNCLASDHDQAFVRKAVDNHDALVATVKRQVDALLALQLTVEDVDARKHIKSLIFESRTLLKRIHA